MLYIGLVKMRVAVKSGIHARLQKSLSVALQLLHKQDAFVVYISVYRIASMLFKALT